jgi:AraC-like DNA-binding protein
MPEADRKLIEKAEELVRSHLADPELSVESLSVGLNMSRVQLYKRMLEITSETPSVFIRDIRLKEAEKLLLDGSFTVSEVAYKVGFNNPRYFSKYFSEAYGIKPSQYRKKNKGSVQY